MSAIRYHRAGKEICFKESTQLPAPTSTSSVHRNSGGSENQSPQNWGFRGFGIGNFFTRNRLS